jgi:ribosomal protein S20
MRRFLKFAIVAGAIGALVGASISIAASSDSKSGTRNDGPRKHGLRFHRAPLARGAVLKSAADKLNVSPTQLRNALRDAFESVGPPEPPKTMDRNAFRAAMQQHCTAVTDAVGKTLKKSGDDVRSAFKSAATEQVDKAQSSGRITEAQAKRIKSKLNSESCVLAGPGGHGCGPGGRGPMGPPPDMNGSQRNGSQQPNQQQSAPAPAFDAVPA